MNVRRDGAPTRAGAPRSARILASRAQDGLGELAAGRDPAPEWSWRSPQERVTAYTALGLATLALCIISVAGMHPVAGPGLKHMAAPAHVGVGPLPLWRMAVAIAVVAPLPLAFWRPLLAWRIGWAGLLLVPAIPAAWWGGWPWGPPQLLALLVAFCLTGIRHRRAVLWWAWALTLIPWWLWLQADIPDLNGPASATVAFTAAAVAADSVALRLRAQRALATETRRSATEREQRAALEERTRIARELHDVVAHHMSLIAVQAETAPYRLAGLPESVSAEFGSLSAAAREALADMRRLLGVLRQDEPAGLAPQPQLSDVPALVDAARRAGVSVELAVGSELASVPAGVGLCAYRIVQESLSNAGRHAPGSAVVVSVDQQPSAIVLRVENGPGEPADSEGNGGGAGLGLTGMRERVALLGGRLSAGPAPGGGFLVCAVLPFGRAA
jgi:signal transduction histidine kinase